MNKVILKTLSEMYKDGFVNEAQRGILKEKLMDQDSNLKRAYHQYKIDLDKSLLFDRLRRLVLV